MRAGKAGRTARVQVLLEEPGGRPDGGGDVADRAMLLCYRQRQWYLEGVYE
jgi:protein ImuB